MATTTTPRLESHIRQVFHDLFERKDFSKRDAWWSERSVDHFHLLGNSATGPDELEAYFRGLFAALPDLRMAIEQVTSDEDARRVVVQWHLTGTFDGATFQGIEPTGKELDLRGCDVFELDEKDRVLVNNVYGDGAEFARQVGMLPQRDSPADKAILAVFNGSTRLRSRLSRR